MYKINLSHFINFHKLLTFNIYKKNLQKQNDIHPFILMNNIIYNHTFNIAKNVKDEYANSVAQDDEQHNTALRQRNHKKHKRKNLIYVKNHLFILKERKKICKEMILSKK
jgi:5-methylcytosine-specific restriction endonuclease McrA